MAQRPFQNAAKALLLEGKSLLLHAPTGIGKTWGTAGGFVDQLGEGTLGVRLLHVLPMRALAESVRDDLDKRLALNARLRSKDVNLEPGKYRTAVHHGQQPESRIFNERLCVTTVDQYFAAFAGSPLSFSSRSGHALAGAIIGSYSVFDEVHLLEPERGLPMLYAVLKQRQRWGLPSAVMTATLPKSVRQFLIDEVGLSLVELTGEDIQARDGWRRVTLNYSPTPSSAADAASRIVEAQKTKGRVLAFANTVEGSLELYRAIGALEPGCELFLVHSNFAPGERKARERQIVEALKEASSTQAIVVTTQVCEAGINISAPVVFSELAPVDSLIQRAGRCARFGDQPEGTLEVYAPTTHEGRKARHFPYNETLVDRTEIALQNRSSSFRLEWKTECELVDEVLDDYYARFVRGERVSQKEGEIKRAKKGHKTELPDIPKSKVRALTSGDALGLFDQAFFARDPRTLEQTLREITNVQVVVSDLPLWNVDIVGGGDFSHHSAPKTLKTYLDGQSKLPSFLRDTLESVPVSLGRFMRYLEGVTPYELTLHYDGTRKEFPLYSLERADRILPNHTYVLSSVEAGYSAELGLTFQGELPGAISTRLVPPHISDRGSKHHLFQNWHDHCLKVYEQADKMLKTYQPFLEQISAQISQDGPGMAATVSSLMRVAVLFHDIGKLNMHWQRAIGWLESDGEFWGKSQEERKVSPLPPHAFHALPALLYLFEKLGVVDDKGKVQRLAELIAMASARHHSLGSPDGKMHWTTLEPHPEPGRTLEAVRKLVREALREDAEQILPLINDDFLRSFAFQSESEKYDQDDKGFYRVRDTPSPSEDFYPFYVLASRVVKVGDWEASGETEVELCR